MESQHRPFRVLVGRVFDRGLNPEPIAHSPNFAEWDAGLGHAKRTWIHSQEQNPFPAVTVTPQVNLVRTPGVNERIVNMRDWRREPQLVNRVAQMFRRRD